MPPETKALGYRAIVDVSITGKGIPADVEGVKNRNTILMGPTRHVCADLRDQRRILRAIDNVSKGGEEEAFQMNLIGRRSRFLVAHGARGSGGGVPVHVTRISEAGTTGYAYLRLGFEHEVRADRRHAAERTEPLSTENQHPPHARETARSCEFNVRGELVATVARILRGRAEPDFGRNPSTEGRLASTSRGPTR
jgi:hypothetical protein